MQHRGELAEIFRQDFSKDRADNRNWGSQTWAIGEGMGPASHIGVKSSVMSGG